MELRIKVEAKVDRNLRNMTDVRNVVLTAMTLIEFEEMDRGTLPIKDNDGKTVGIVGWWPQG